MNNINAITDNHRDNRLDCELNHHGYPIQVSEKLTLPDSNVQFTNALMHKVLRIPG